MITKKTKAESLMIVLSDIQEGKAITWTIYKGSNILDFTTVSNYVSAFLNSGEIMPLPFEKGMGLNIISVQTETEVNQQMWTVIVDGIITKLKGA